MTHKVYRMRKGGGKEKGGGKKEEGERRIRDYAGDTREDCSGQSEYGSMRRIARVLFFSCMNVTRRIPIVWPATHMK
jgi:hypothetical protein